MLIVIKLTCIYINSLIVCKYIVIIITCWHNSLLNSNNTFCNLILYTSIFYKNDVDLIIGFKNICFDYTLGLYYLYIIYKQYIYMCTIMCLL